MNNDWRLYSDELYHHGIKGQKWGVRRFQNDDGTLTSAGRSRYGDKADKVQKAVSKAERYETKAANAKTRFGRDWNAGLAESARQKADITGAKAEGDYNAWHFNKWESRAHGSSAESQANIAKKLKERAENETNVKKSAKLMDEAVQRLATAENHEIYAKAFKEIANTPGIINKGVAYFNKLDEASKTSYTAAGRKQTIGDKKLEQVGDAALGLAFGLATGNGGPVNMSGASNKLRDSAYKKQYSADERYQRILDNKK